MYNGFIWLFFRCKNSFLTTKPPLYTKKLYKYSNKTKNKFIKENFSSENLVTNLYIRKDIYKL